MPSPSGPRPTAVTQAWGARPRCRGAGRARSLQRQPTGRLEPRTPHPSPACQEGARRPNEGGLVALVDSWRRPPARRGGEGESCHVGARRGARWQCFRPFSSSRQQSRGQSRHCPAHPAASRAARVPGGASPPARCPEARGGSDRGSPKPTAPPHVRLRSCGSRQRRAGSQPARGPPGWGRSGARWRGGGSEWGQQPQTYRDGRGVRKWSSVSPQLRSVCP